MSVILSLDTSSTSCSVALHACGKLLSSAEIHKEHSQASKLAILVDQVLKNVDISISDLAAIAVSSGPGSYTGLRIGTSTAKGLCFALNIPLIAVDSLSVMAHLAVGRVASDILLCPMLDARRMEVYCALFDHSLQFIEPIQAKIIDDKSFMDHLAHSRVAFFGDGSAKCKSALENSNSMFLENIYPSAVELGKLAFEKFEKQEFVDVIHFEPLYLKEFLIKTSSKAVSS